MLRTPNSAFIVCTVRRMPAMVSAGFSLDSIASTSSSSSATAPIACETNMPTVSAKCCASSASGTVNTGGGTSAPASSPRATEALQRLA